MGAAAAGPVHAGQARAHRGNRAARPEHDPADSSAHAVPVAWRADVASARAGGCSMTRASNASSARVARSKGVPFSKNPVLAVRLPVWRSRVVLFVLFAAFAGLAARALWLQGLTTQFLQKQGEIRYARTLDLPATRGKITDRDGQVLASSVPVKAIWAIPDDVQEAPPEKLKALAKLLDMSDDELKKKLDSDRGFVYLKRQVEQDVADQITKLGIDGIQTRKEYKRFYPQGEVATHVVGFTNVEDAGQEAMELAQQKTLVGMPGSRRVIKDRLGHIVEDIESVREPHDGKDLTLSIDSKIQYIAFTQLKDAVEKFHAKAGAAVVLDVRTGEVLALANWPSYNPNDHHADRRAAAQPRHDRYLRAGFLAQAVHGRPGAGHQPRHAVHQVRHRQRLLHHRRQDHPRHPRPRRHRRAGNHPEVVQHRHFEDRAVDAAAGHVGDVHQGRPGPAAQVGLPRRRRRPRASL